MELRRTLPAGMALPPSPLAPILEHLRSRTSRTWSIVVTVFGDAVVPRGGSIGIASLLEIFAAMGIRSGVVRTAMSRLATDDWLQSSRVGRSSFYRLTSKGQASFAAAANRVYGKPAQAWDGRFHLLLPGDGAGHEAVRAALERAGFGTAAGTWVAPTTTQVPAEAASLIRIEGCMALETARRLAEQVWTLTETAAAYERFLQVFRPLLAWSSGGQRLSDLEALVARILLVHEYRRVVLRDPLLPLPLLPEHWPGVPARQLCAAVYPALLPGAERWLSQNGRNEDGPLPPAVALRRRFNGGAEDQTPRTAQNRRALNVTENL